MAYETVESYCGRRTCCPRLLLRAHGSASGDWRAYDGVAGDIDDEGSSQVDGTHDGALGDDDNDDEGKDGWPKGAPVDEEESKTRGSCGEYSLNDVKGKAGRAGRASRA